MTLPFPRRVIPLAALLATGSLALAACSSPTEDPAAPSGQPADSAVTAAPTAAEGTGAPEQPDEAQQPSAPLPELPAVESAAEGDGTINFGANPLTEVEPVAAEPDAVSFFVDPAEGLHTDSGMVTIHWAATADGVPISADDCRGMLSITGPEGGTLTFEPDVSGCAGSTGILLRESVGALPGDYLVQVSLDRAEGEQTIHVTAA